MENNYQKFKSKEDFREIFRMKEMMRMKGNWKKTLWQDRFDFESK